MNEWRVEIRRYEDEGLEKTLGPFASERTADKADDGVNRQLNHDRFFTVIVEAGSWPNE